LAGKLTRRRDQEYTKTVMSKPSENFISFDHPELGHLTIRLNEDGSIPESSRFIVDSIKTDTASSNPGAEASPTTKSSTGQNTAG
jgi:hypothetical protein